MITRFIEALKIKRYKDKTLQKHLVSAYSAVPNIVP